MKQKQKIIILLSSLSLGGAILLIPFLGKSDSPQKKKHLTNNSPKEKENNRQLLQNKKKEKKTTVLRQILIVIVIIVALLAIFLITKLLIKKIKKINAKKFDNITNSSDPDLKKYLSGSCRVVVQQNKIKIYFCPYSLPKENEVVNRLYHFDIDKNKKEIPPELQNIYNDLKQKNIFAEFGDAIADFFKFFDGCFLCAFH